MPTPYEYDDTKLVNAFMLAATKAGASNSGLVIDIMAGSNLEDLHYLKGCMLARLAGVKPEFTPGQLVHVSEDKKVQGKKLDGYGYDITPLSTGTYTVRKVWYMDLKFFVELQGIRSRENQTALFPAEDFKAPTLVEQAV